MGLTLELLKMLPQTRANQSGEKASRCENRGLLTLCAEMTKLLDKPYLAEYMGPATLKLSNAMADYRDSRIVDRG